MSALEKHFFRDPAILVRAGLRSLIITNPSLSLDEPNRIIYRRDTATPFQPKVSVISGGGSGHEPGLAGFVGTGLLTAAVAGTIFASPSAEQVRRAVLERVPTEKGVLVLTLNYTGDVLSFGLAAEKARAAGVRTEFHAMGDDVGVGREKGGKVGRRGIAGVVLVVKIACALAELGGSLKETYELAKLVSANLVSVGSSMEHVHVPGRGSMESLMPADTVEVGMGIHNEPGCRTVRASLPALVGIMLAQLLDPKDQDRHYVSFKEDDRAVLLVNNLGGLSVLELGGIVTEVIEQLKNSYKIVPVRVLAGAFLTSLNGLGFSISLLRLEDTGLGPGKSMLELLDLPAEATGWAAPIPVNAWEAGSGGVNNGEPAIVRRTIARSNLALDPEQARSALEAGLRAVIAVESDVTRYDTIVGDGDCGIGLKRGAEALLERLSGELMPADAVSFVDNLVPVVEGNMDGTSGAIYAIFLNALVAALRDLDMESTSSREMDADAWGIVLGAALRDLGKYTPAARGDRTLMDALFPFVETLRNQGTLRAAAEKAMEGAEATKRMKASLGRAVYVGAVDDWIGKVPDPGAWGLQAFLVGLADGVGKSS